MLRLALPLLCTVVLPAQRSTDADRPDPARDLFASGAVLRIEITMAPAERQKLRDAPREYVPAAVRVDGGPVWDQAGVKLKGAAGSFREVDDRPGFTVHLGKFGQSWRLSGLTRFHLNNGAQDDSRLCEWLGCEVFTAAGRPAPRVGHALVSLDGKALGLYVLREAYDSSFLRRAFGHTEGNLYDGGFCQDIDAELEKDSGDGPDDRADLQALRALCAGVDRGRADRLARAVDLDAFLDFAALEAMLGHWDGYCQNRNNYRLWCDHRSGRALFLPHGMDQLLGDAEAPVLAHPPAIVASAVMQQPSLRKRYRERLRALLPAVDPAKLVPRLEQKSRQLVAALDDVDRDGAVRLRDAGRDLIDRTKARHGNLVEQARAPEPKPIVFAAGRPFVPKTWHPAAEGDDVTLARRPFDAAATLHAAIPRRADEPRRGSWRTTVLLGRGRYRLVARARCSGIEGPPAEPDGSVHGGVRLCVGDATSEHLLGDSGWRELACEFEVAEFQRDVELSLELRALAGKAWFHRDSLQLHRLPD